MFNIELKFACDILMCWFNEKFKKPRTNLSNLDSIEYRRLNPITSDTKCVICDFAIEVDPKGLKYKENDTSYLDFLIRKEYAFFKNIFDEDELKESKRMCDLESYWDEMQLYLHLIKVSEIELKSANFFSDISDELLLGFLMEYCDAYKYDVEELVENEIKKFKINHNKTMKMPKFTLQLYSFLYDCLMNFPSVKFDEIKTVTPNGFMKELYRVINYKVHIHHSHVTGEIHGYSHDFCNWKLRENQLFVPLIGHNFLGFDIYYMVKGYRSSVWGTKDFTMGGTNLINVNFANISSQVKIIDTLKYYQTSANEYSRHYSGYKNTRVRRNPVLFKCGGCNATYYGKTKRHFKIRMCEHLGVSALTGKRVKGDNDSDIKEHLLFCNYSSGFDDFCIPASNNNDFKVTLMESLLINRDHPPLNKNRHSLPLELFDD